jgi:hypothetical protein
MRQTHAIPLNQSALVSNYPSPPPQQQPKPSKIYRVIISSHDRLSGDVNNGVYRVRLPRSPKSSKCKLFVEFFAYESDVNGTLGVLDRYTYHVHLAELNQPDSYHSKTDTTTNIILTNKTREYVADITHDTLGIPMNDKRLFEEGTINIYFSSSLIGQQDLGSKDWTMVLVINEYDT